MERIETRRLDSKEHHSSFTYTSNTRHARVSLYISSVILSRPNVYVVHSVVRPDDACQLVIS